jgi:putative transposase
MTAAIALAPEVGVQAACAAFCVPRATLYRRRRPRLVAVRRSTWRALTETERAAVLRILYDPRFMDASPAEVHATLLDEGLHLASVSTMYRLLRDHGAVRERRALRPRAVHVKPQLVATGPNQVWSWDITKIRSLDRRVWFHLYVILDIFSRKVVGWMLAPHESGALAERFIAETMVKEDVLPSKLTLHSDRGTSMRSKTVAEFLADIGVTKSHSRPRTSNDNPFSESQFKTMKYCPFFPGSFATITEGREFFELFFRWYNEEHHHSGIAMMTPATVHDGRIDSVVSGRQRALDEAWKAHPERFVQGAPVVARPPTEVYINNPIHEVALPKAETKLATELHPEKHQVPSRQTQR